MRKHVPAAVAAENDVSLAAVRHRDAAVEAVCLGLALALVALAFRIVTIW